MSSYRIVWTIAVVCAALRPWSSAAELKVTGTDGYITFESRIQVVYVREFPGGAGDQTGTDAGGISDAGDNRFYVKQARLNLHGAYLDRIDYKLTAELGSSAAPLRDACIGIRALPWLKADVGQFKVPFSFDRLTSGEHYPFVDRPDVAHTLVPGRDIGVMADLEDTGRRYRLRAGVFTGRGQNMATDDSRGRPLWAVRAEWAPFSHLLERKNPLPGSVAPALALGVNAALSDDGEIGPGGPVDSIDGRKLLYGVDLAARFRGLWIGLEANQADFTPRDTGESPYRAFGYLVQATWYVAVFHVEPAVRYDALDPDSRSDSDWQRTLSLGINAYPLDDGRLKVMVDYAHRFPAVEQDTAGWDDDDLRVMVQVVLR